MIAEGHEDLDCVPSTSSDDTSPFGPIVSLMDLRDIISVILSNNCLCSGLVSLKAFFDRILIYFALSYRILSFNPIKLLVNSHIFYIFSELSK